MGVLAPVIKQRFFDSDGNPLSGGKLYSYIAGTTTPRVTYVDEAQSAANTNPIILDANGECDLWMIAGFYKFVLTDANDVNQWTVDRVSAFQTSTVLLTPAIPVQWFSPSGFGAIKDEEFQNEIFRFSSSANQAVRTQIKVPQSYLSGYPITLNVTVYSESAENNFAFFSVAYLLKANESTADSVVNSMSTFLPDTVNTIANQIRSLSFALSDVDGTINSVEIEPGDTIIIQLNRIDAATSEDTADIRLLNTSNEVTFV